MPGGGVARRPLHFIIMGDCSGSMKGPKMQALNTALRAMLPHLVRWEKPLDRFRSRDAPVLVAETIDVIVDRLVAASIAVSRMSEAGADRGALAQQLLQPEVVPGSGLDDDPIL
jgi:uncharacterized protein YegL